MKINFDYRFDTEGFFTTERKAALNLAGDIWSNLLKDNFTEVPENTELTLQNPQTGASETLVLEEAIDDLVIFVGASPEPFNELITETTNSLAKAQYNGVDLEGDIFQRRISGNFRGQGAVTDFEPWVGAISFVSNPAQPWDFSLSNPDLSKVDFVSVALHEIGHVLGVGTAPIFDVLSADGAFEGVNAREVNNGNPIPLETDLGHIVDGFAEDSVLLDSVLAPGRRSPSAIDLAILADIGYEIDNFTKQGSLPEIATEEGEVILGTTMDDNITGLAGNDEIQGNSGDDTLLGDDGNDTLFGNTGQDELFGQDGDDSLLGESGEDFLSGGAGIDTLYGDLADDTLKGDDGNDFLFGGEGNDFLFGNSDDDRLEGDVGNDILRGGDADDTLYGQDGDDSIEGGRGNDNLIGDTGSDRFEFGFDFGQDRIEDFQMGEDAIAVSAKYDFATDTYDFNDNSEIIAAITDTGSVPDTTNLVTEITLRESNTITVIHDQPLTTEDFAIYFPFQSQVTATSSGFTIQFNQEFNLDTLNLYPAISNDENIADLKLTSNSTGETINGSLVLSISDRSLTFVKTDGVLIPDDYSLTLFSRGNGFTSDTGELLDGDRDGIAGDNFVTQFTIEATEQPVLSLDDFSRGIGQRVNSALDDEGLAISLENGAEITQVDLTLTYDANIFALEDIIVNPEIEDNWTLTKDLTTPGTAIISLSGTTPLTSEKIDLVQLQAIIPETATNGASGMLTLETISLNDGEITAIGDSTFQQVTYLGDTNGDLIYTDADAYNISQLVTGITDGLTDFELVNPQIIADVNGDGVISAFDSYLVATKALGNSVDFIPDLPGD